MILTALSFELASWLTQAGDWKSLKTDLVQAKTSSVRIMYPDYLVDIAEKIFILHKNQLFNP